MPEVVAILLSGAPSMMPPQYGPPAPPPEPSHDALWIAYAVAVAIPIFGAVSATIHNRLTRPRR